MLTSASDAVDEALVIVELPLRNRGHVQELLPHYLRFLNYLRAHLVLTRQVSTAKDRVRNLEPISPAHEMP